MQYAREGIELSVSTVADHVGACTAALLPLYELIKAHVFAAKRIHGDETTVPVLAKVKTRTGRLWTYSQRCCQAWTTRSRALMIFRRFLADGRICLTTPPSAR
jgi:hypothetical protein